MITVNQKFITISLVASFLFVANFALAQVQDITHSRNAIYIEVGDCVQQYEYTYTDKKSYETAYYDYHVALNDFETAIFKVSKYASETVAVNQLPKRNVLKCGSNLGKIFDEKLLDAVRNADKDVYIIRKTSDGYEVGRAINASYAVYLPNDKYYRFVGKEFGFDYDGKKEYSAGAELLQNPTEGMGNFAYRSDKKMNCLDQVNFMRIPVEFMKSTDLEYVLDIGLVREYSDNMERRLIAIDGQPFEMLIAKKCNISIPTENVVSNTPIIEAEVILTNPIIETEVNMGTETVSRSGNEIRPKKMLSVPVSRSNDFGDIDELLVPYTNKSTSSVTADTELMKIIESEGSTAKSGTENVNIEVQYQPKSTPKETTKIEGFKYHKVKQGETLYKISKLYKLSIKQLKDLNKLESNTIEINQELRVN